MDDNQKHFILEAMQRLSSTDFECVLNYYGIEVKRRSILCIYHNDTHYGSCSLSRDGRKAFCFVCNRPIDAVDIVMHKDGLNYIDAAKKIWVDILGNPMPETGQDKQDKNRISWKDLQFLGLTGAGGGVCEQYVNACPCTDKEEPYASSVMAFEGAVVVKDESVRIPSITALMKTDPEIAKKILLQKTEGLIRKYKKITKDIDDEKSELCSLIPDKEKRERLKIDVQKKLKKAYVIQKKIRTNV